MKSVLWLLLPCCMAEPTRDTLTTCAAIGSQLPGKVFERSNSGQYAAEQQNYWSYSNAQEEAACIVFAESAQEVSTTIKELRKSPNVRFTVKSGGHNPNPAHSSVADGVLIALSRLKGTTYDKERHVARVKPGGEWRDVLEALEPHGVTVVGGRLDIVGIGGYITSGGISFLSAEHGLSADTVVEFETVLPNGTIQAVNRLNYPELFRAMKGGVNNFGIVTEFTMRAIPIDQVWGGSKIYQDSHRADLLEALQDFAENNNDTRAAIILVFHRIAGFVLPDMFYFYNGAVPPAGAFRKFEAISALSDSCKTQSYASLLHANSRLARSIPNQRATFRTQTIPIFSHNGSYVPDMVLSIWDAAHKAELGISALPTLAFQPFPASIGKASEASGGNAMGLRATDRNRMILELSNNYVFESNDARVLAAARRATEQVERLRSAVLRSVEVAGAAEYHPMLVNDAQWDQDPFRSFRDHDTLAALQRSVDPDGFFHSRIGGFKFSREL